MNWLLISTATVGRSTASDVLFLLSPGNQVKSADIYAERPSNRRNPSEPPRRASSPRAASTRCHASSRCATIISRSASCSGAPVVARLTRRSAHALELAVGLPVWAQVKTVALME